MTGFDIAVLALIVLSALLGLWRGVIRELFALAAWVVALMASFAIGGTVAAMLPKLQLSDDALWLRSLLGHALVFVLAFVVLSVAGFVLSRLVRAVGLGLLDRAAGMVFGVLRGVLIIVLAVLVAGATTLPSFAWWQHSVSARPLTTLAALLRSKLPADLAARLRPPPAPGTSRSAPATPCSSRSLPCVV